MATKKKHNPSIGFKESANEIWLAGLGAFNFVGEEGSRLFQELVFTERAMGLKEDAKNVLSKVTTPIEEGLSSTMQRLGMPTRTEIVKLTHRVEELTRIVQQAKKPKAESPVRTKAEPVARPKPKAKAKPKAKVAAETTA